eukprot:scaffold2946_cov278-Chaetoceros_neogracile.AAC.10
MSCAPIHVQHEIQQQVNRIWLESPGIGTKDLIEKLNHLISSSEQIITKPRVKAAKQSIPHRFLHPYSNSDSNLNDDIKSMKINDDDDDGDDDSNDGQSQTQSQSQTVPTLTEKQKTFVQKKLNERSSLRSLRRYKDADEIMKGLTTMGIIADDGMRTWTISNTHTHARTSSLYHGADTKDTIIRNGNSKSDTNNNQSLHKNCILCQSCNTYFKSKNLLFRHLRDVSTTCGNVIFANGQKMPDAPSSLVKKQKQEVAKNSRRKKTGRAIQHAAPEASLWFGDLPLPYTRLGGQYRRLMGILRECLPRDVPQPWIKKVVRKGYRQGKKNNDSMGGGDHARQKEQTPELEPTEQVKGKYLGFAIIIFRDEQEATNVKEALDGYFIDPVKIFTHAPECHDLPTFRLKVKNVEKDTSSTYNSDGSNDAVLPLKSGNLDPPLEDQFRPLSIHELQERCECINRRLEGSGKVFLPHALGEEEGSFPVNEHTVLLQHTVELYNQLGPRDEVHWKGRAVPESICNSLLTLLKNVRWPASSHRKGLTSERYLVLQTNVSNDRFYQDLRDGCRELMQLIDPDYYYSGIAVTKNFVASPHIDDRDQSFQYAISLGEFTQGGQLCVEGIHNSSDGREKPDFVNVVETHNRIARVDGRHVHWVRTWEKGDRYSLIFYDTTERKRTSIMKTGLDVSFVQESMQ